MQAGRRGELRRVVLTASGGPFRNHTAEQLAGVTVADALAHPTWKMGKKITVDSATLMNKALEIIEARWLFGLPPERIDVIVHPESVIHSFVVFKDGSVLAQLGNPFRRIGVDRDGRTGIDFGVYGVPETYVLDKAGRIRWRHVGPLTAESVDKELLPLLQQLGRS